MNGKLYIVATPVGNLGDMTPRAIDILRGADIIAAEDTQNSMTLLTKFDIKTKLVSNHKFNETSSVAYFINELLSGKNVALISDAGTPCISDPGSVLVKKAAENNIEVLAIPGACAAAAAVSISGFDVKSFIFEGFFPRENTETKRIIKKLTDNPGVYIFYESPKRIIKTFETFAGNIPGADICLCNDLTKKFEKVYRGSPAEVLQNLRNNPSAEKGEYTIVIELVGNAAINERSSFCVPRIAPNENPSLESIIVDVMIKQKCTVKDAVKHIASDGAYGFSKNEVYAASLGLKKMFNDIVK